MQNSPLNSPKSRKVGAVNSFPCLVRYRAKIGKFIVKVNSKFSICKLSCFLAFWRVRACFVKSLTIFVKL